jgi:hypothetical protein
VTPSDTWSAGAVGRQKRPRAPAESVRLWVKVVSYET